MSKLPDWFLHLHNAMDERVGLEVLEVGPDRTVGRMPVQGNTQPMGFWHGGATCVLAESLGSVAATAHGMTIGKVALGVDISATHHRSARGGWVTGVATPLSLGRRVTSHEIVLTDDDGRRVATARLTCQLVDPPTTAP